MASERDKMISEVISVGMLRRDVATDIVDALLAKWWIQTKRCSHPRGSMILTEVGLARQCADCGYQDFTAN